MPTTAIGKDLNYGYAGKVSRNPMNKITSRMVKSILNGSNVETASNVTFGHAVVINTDGTVSDWADAVNGLSGVSDATAANFSGVAVAEVQQTFSYGLGAGGASPAGYYVPAQAADVLNSGSATVFLPEGTPTAGGAVYIVTGGTTTTSPIGSFATAATTASGATGVALSNVTFTTGKVDSNNITEITLRYASNV